MSEHEEMEMGRDLDQALRAAIMGLAQLLEKAARRAAQRDQNASQDVMREAMNRLQQGTPEQGRPAPDSQKPGTINDTTGAKVDDRELVRSWAQAATEAIQNPSDHEAASAAAIAAEQLRRRGVDPVARLGDYLVDRAADRADESRSKQAAEQVVIPAGRENADRGMAPSKASSPEEAEHRRQAWSVARGAHAEAFDGDAAAAEKAWVGLPQQEQWDRFWKAYDTEAARTVGTADAAAFLERIGAPSPQEDTPVERVVELPTKQPGEQVQAVPEAPAAADMGAAAAAERGMKPSTAATPEEAEHRRRAWTLARADFATTLPEGTSKADVETKWRQLPWQDQALYYWKAYDGPAAAAPVTPAAAQAAEAGSTISRERVVELNGQAAKFFTDNAGPGSQGREYLEGRLGRGIVEDGAWQVGYAPAGWTNLTAHLRKNGATNEEILAAGLGVRSSRGNIIDTFRDRAMVGVRDESGATVGFVGRDLSGDPRAPKYTNTTATPAFSKGRVLLGVHEAPAGADLVRVEGPFDAIAVTRAGEGRVAGVAPLGTALTDEQADVLVQRAAGGRVLLGLDNDAAGRAATEADFWRLSQRGVDPRLLLLPPGQDPAQVWRENPAALRTLTGTTMVAPSAAIVVVERAVDELGAELRAGSPEAHEELAATYDRLSATLPEADQAQLRSYGQRLIDQLEAGADDARDRAARFGQVEDDARADMNAGNSDLTPDLNPDLDRPQVDGQSVEAQQSVDDDRGRAEQAHDRENAETTRAEQFDDAAGRARADLPASSASGPTAADRSHDVGHGAGHEVGRRAQPAPQYDRAAETPGRDVPPEAKQARRVSAWGYDRSTSSMLGAASDRAGRSAKRSTAPTQNSGRNRRRGK